MTRATGIRRGSSARASSALRDLSVGFLMVALAAMATACSGCRDVRKWWESCGSGPLAGVSPEITGSDGVHEADVDRSKLITTPDGREFPVNMVVVRVASRTSRARVDRLAASVGGRVVGQVPRFCYYQIEVPATTRLEQQAIMGRLRARWGVRAASENTIGVKLYSTRPP